MTHPDPQATSDNEQAPALPPASPVDHEEPELSDEEDIPADEPRPQLDKPPKSGTRTTPPRA